VGNQGAGWLHQNTALRGFLPSLPAIKTISSLPIAPPEWRHKVYSELLRDLTLSSYHRENLLSRGFSQTEIDQNSYRTLSYEGRESIIIRLQKSGLDFSGVPGFWRDTHGLHLAGRAGILIPVKNIWGQILGLQIRCDHVKEGKYRWLSSSGRPLGSSPGVPIHVALSPLDYREDEIWITEGPLKADIASHRLGRIVLGIPGVANWIGVLPILKELAPRRVVVAYDMDKYTNFVVESHKNSLIDCLVGKGYRTFEAEWSVNYKGLDDILGKIKSIG
jgi:hypothetical protein